MLQVSGVNSARDKSSLHGLSQPAIEVKVGMAADDLVECGVKRQATGKCIDQAVFTCAYAAYFGLKALTPDQCIFALPLA